MKTGEVRIIVAGGRDFDDYSLLHITLSNYIEENLRSIDRRKILFISGTAKGADQIGEMFADTNNFAVKRFTANWDKYQKAAGPIRNKQMAEYAAEETGVLFAFWDSKSRGTKNMINTAERYGLEVHVINY